MVKLVTKRRSWSHNSGNRRQSWHHPRVVDAPAAARKRVHLSGRADRPEAAYLRAAQAYMLISMPTDTSTIFGAFQAIRTSLSFCVRAFEIRTGIAVTQVFTADHCDM